MSAPTDRDHREALAKNLDRIGLPTYAEAVRALPVLATCGECGWCGPTSGGWSCDHPTSIAAVQRTIPRCPQGGHVDHDSAPPINCPLRGGVR